MHGTGIFHGIRGRPRCKIWRVGVKQAKPDILTTPQEPPTPGGFPFALVQLRRIIGAAPARQRPKGRFSFKPLFRRSILRRCPYIAAPANALQRPLFAVLLGVLLCPVLPSLHRQKSNTRSFSPVLRRFSPDFSRKTHQAPAGFCAGESLS